MAFLPVTKWSSFQLRKVTKFQKKEPQNEGGSSKGKGTQKVMDKSKLMTDKGIQKVMDKSKLMIEKKANKQNYGHLDICLLLYR